MTRNEFMRKMAEVQNNGRVHTAKLAGHVYDLIDEKIASVPLPVSLPPSAIPDTPGNLKELQEISHSLLQLEKSFAGLDERLCAIESELKQGNGKSKGRKLKLKKE